MAVGIITEIINISVIQCSYLIPPAQLRGYFVLVTLEKPTNGSVAVKLTSRGTYSWVIDLPIPDGDDGDKTIDRLKKIDTLLKDRFPNYVKTSTVRSKSFDPYSD